MNVVQVEAKVRESNDDNLIPLINVVFLMLIFFMVAGVIRETDKAEIGHPESVSTKALATETLTILVNKDLSIQFQDATLTIETLTQALKKIVEMKQSVEDLYLVLRVDSSLSAKRLHEVLKSIRAAGLLKVQLLTELGEAA